MHTALENPDVGNNRHNIETAFGQNADIARIKANVKLMQDGTMNVPALTTANPDVFASAVRKTNPNGGQDPVLVDGRTQYKYMTFGTPFFAPGNDVDNRAGTLIHEASHYLAGTRDHVIQEQHTDGSISQQMDQPGHTMTNPTTINGLGCK